MLEIIIIGAIVTGVTAVVVFIAIYARNIAKQRASWKDIHDSRLFDEDYHNSDYTYEQFDTERHR